MIWCNAAVFWVQHYARPKYKETWKTYYTGKPLAQPWYFSWLRRW